ncbi:MAG: hypothetical protein A2288_01180 [Candidatus Moranbacteria bacterium RIFOXYA12_FULL_44_15]|nr:MAG: hypothetical protein A2288_01180 [Candidatus Moranbacteria bacterium RIFOXYA12_FULL_44_15]OGI36233.1 MAG: hypothetical protein A2259_02305 [Candidatus Moranbacteria bacterium RIFOXYA2_FULL_43_15]
MTGSKKVVVSVLALTAVLGAGAYGIKGISGANAAENGRGFFLVEKIAEKFGLNKDEVEKVFEENRQEQQTRMKTNSEEKLSEAVSKGELTETQKQLIIAKRAELEQEREKNREAHRNLSDEERKAEMEKQRAEMNGKREALEKWAKENGIDMAHLMGMGGGMNHGGRHNGGSFEEGRKNEQKQK